MTPCPTAVEISSFDEPEPPWKTRYLGYYGKAFVKSKPNENSQRLIGFALLLLHIFLVFPKKVGKQFDVTRLVNAVHVSERSSDAEIGSDLAQRGVHIVDVFRLRVQTSVVGTGVVDAILLATGDSDLHLEPEAERRHAFEVLGAYFDVLFFGVL